MSDQDIFGCGVRVPVRLSRDAGANSCRHRMDYATSRGSVFFFVTAGSVKAAYVPPL